jgi:hypothetical protein
MSSVRLERNVAQCAGAGDGGTHYHARDPRSALSPLGIGMHRRTTREDMPELTYISIKRSRGLHAFAKVVMETGTTKPRGGT